MRLDGSSLDSTARPFESTATHRSGATRRSATGAASLSSRRTARSTGSACRTSTRLRLLPAPRRRGGGAFRLEPTEPVESERRYRGPTDVVETTFRTAFGAVGVTDSLTLADRTIAPPMRELVRAVEDLRPDDAALELGRAPACSWGITVAVGVLVSLG